jgi:cardiolipin synthase
MSELPFVLYFITLLLIPVVLMRRHEAATAVAWIFTVTFIPFVGPLVYLIVGIRPVGRARRRKWMANEQIRRFLQDYQRRWSASSLHQDYGGIHANQQAVMQLITRLGLFPTTRGNRITYHVDPQETYQLMEEAIQHAEHHVNLDYYIFRPDSVGRRFADILAAKAAHGVEINLLYDTLGSWSLHHDKQFRRRLTDNGVRVHPFLVPKLVLRPWYLNLRNHRKILVVDGRVGFAGGLNIGEAFVAAPRKFGIWRDAHLRIEGPAVLELQWVFAEDWYFATGDELIRPEYFPEPEARGDNVVQVLPSGPEEELEPVHMAFFTAMTSAAEEIFLCTPYFIPDSAILRALQSAALRGVDVRLLVPRRSDHMIVTLAGRSYYDDLLACGVKIYEFLPGVEHSKVVVVDGRLSIVGSANMDIRSFSYNFEISAQVYGEEFARRVRSIFLEELEQSEAVDPEKFNQRNLAVRFAENSCRVLSPML